LPLLRTRSPLRTGTYGNKCGGRISLSRHFRILFFGSLLSVSLVCVSQPQKAPPSFPVYLTKDFDFAAFTRFEAQAPPKDHLVQSNGFLTLVEEQFGKHAVLILAPVDDAPGNTSDRLAALEVDSPALLDSSR